MATAPSESGLEIKPLQPDRISPEHGSEQPGVPEDKDIWDLSGMLFDAYEEILDHVPSEDQKVAKFVIPIVAACDEEQLLGTRELAVAYLLATEIWNDDTHPPANVLNTYAEIYKSCGHLFVLREQDGKTVVDFRDQNTKGTLLRNPRFYELANFIMFKACWKCISLNRDLFNGMDVFTQFYAFDPDDIDLGEEEGGGFLVYAMSRRPLYEHFRAAENVVLTHFTLEDFSRPPVIIEVLVFWRFSNLRHRLSIERLLDLGFQPSPNVIRFACQTRTPRVLELILEKGPPVGPGTKFGSDFLLQAAACQREDIIQLLEEKGARIDGTDEELASQMCTAAMQDNHILISLLLKHGVDPNIAVAKQPSALMIAVSRCRMENITLLLENGANINARSLEDGRTAILHSSHYELELMRFLLRNGADPNIPDDKGHTLMYRCLYYGFHEQMRLVLEHGADPNIMDARGQPLAIAVVCKSDMAKILLEHGADPNSVDDRGVTALCLAARNSDVEMISLLIQKGARKDRIDGKIALLHAAAYENVAVAEFLISTCGASLEDVEDFRVTDDERVIFTAMGVTSVLGDLSAMENTGPRAGYDFIWSRSGQFYDIIQEDGDFWLGISPDPLDRRIGWLVKSRCVRVSPDLITDMYQSESQKASEGSETT